MKILLNLILVLLCVSANAASVRIYFQNRFTLANDTNYILVTAVDTNVLSSGGVSGRGVTKRYTPPPNGYLTNTLAVGHYSLENPTLGTKVLIRVPDTSDFYDYTNLLISGFNTFVTIEPTAAGITNALGYVPATNGVSSGGSATNVTMRAGTGTEVTTNSTSDWTVSLAVTNNTDLAGKATGAGLGTNLTSLVQRSNGGATNLSITGPLSFGGFTEISKSGTNLMLSGGDGDIVLSSAGSTIGNALGLTNGSPNLATNSATATDGQALVKRGDRLKLETISGGSGTTYTNNSGAAGYIVDSGIGTNVPAAQVAAIMATNQWTTTNILYISKFGGLSAAGYALGYGPDSYTAIQSAYDAVTNYPGGAEVHFDIPALSSRTIKGHSNTRTTADPNCGLILSNGVSQYMWVNDLNGNAYTSSNIFFKGMNFWGTGYYQNRYLTNGPYFDTNTVAGRLWPKNGPVAENSSDYWDNWTMAVWISGAQNVGFEDCNFIDTRTFALTLGGKVRDAKVWNCKFYWSPASLATANEDSVHLWSPLDNIGIKKIWSNGDDDTIAINTDELSYVTNANFGAWRGTNNTSSGSLTVEDVWHESDGGGLVRIITYNESYNHHYFTNVTLRGLHGQFNANDDFISGAINTTFTGKATYIHNLILADIETLNGPSTIDLAQVQGDYLSINGVKGVGAPSYYNYNPWNSARETPSYIALGHSWNNASINNVDFTTPAGTTNVVLLGVRYAFSGPGWPGIKNLSINNSSLSGPGITAFVSDLGRIDTLSFNGVTSTNREWIPGSFVSTEPTGGEKYISRTIGMTNWQQDTVLWLRNQRRSGQEPQEHVVRAVDNFNRALTTSGDLEHIYEAGFFGGATNIAAILPKIRTYWTNQWSTNAFMTNSGFTTADLTAYGLKAGNGFLGSQIPITTSGIGALSKTNFSYGVYIQTKAPIVAYDTLYAGASYPATGDTDRFGLESDNTGNGGAPSFWLGNGYGRVAAMTDAGMQSVVVSNSTTTRYVYVNGTLASSVGSYNSSGFQSGTFLVMKGQNYVGPTNGVVSFWYVGDGSVNQSNLAAAVQQLIIDAANTNAGYVTNYQSGVTLPLLNSSNITVTGTTTLADLNVTQRAIVQNLAQPTNAWAINTAIGMGTNAYYTGGAQTLGVTGVADNPTNTIHYGELEIAPTGDIIFTNPVSIKASDYAITRTFTNGNSVIVSVRVKPGVSTNLTFVQFR